MTFKKYFLNTKIQVFILVSLTFLVFSNSLVNKIAWDDHYFIEGWNDIRTFNHIPNILSGSFPEGQGKVYRPLRGILWMINYNLWQDNPFFYHLQALLVHVACTVFVYLIAKLILKDKNMAFLVGLIFGLHTIHTETIDYISSSLETYGSLFFLMSFYFYINKNNLSLKFKKIAYISSVALAICAFFTYEMTLILPILLIWYDLCFNKKNFKEKSYLLTYLPYLVGIVFFLFLRIGIFHIFSRNDYLGYSPYLTFLVMVKVFARYILLLFFPVGLTANHALVGEFPVTMLVYDKLDPVLQQSILNLDFIASAVLLISLIVAAIFYYRKNSLISFGIGWFFISLLPVSYIIPFGGAMAEKYLYISSLGYIFTVVYFVAKSMQKLPQFKSAILVVLGVYLVVLSLLTFQRNTVWYDDISLFKDMEKKLPGNIKANFSLGYWYQMRNDLENSEYYYKKVLEKVPHMWEAHLNLSQIYLAKGKKDLFYKEIVLAATYNPQLHNKVPVYNHEYLYFNDQIKFKYPSDFSIYKSNNLVKLRDKLGLFELNISYQNLPSGYTAGEYLSTRTEKWGNLVNEGLAKIPNVDYAFVRVWEYQPGIQLLQFFLFSNGKVVEIHSYPSSSPFIKELDVLLESIKL